MQKKKKMMMMMSMMMAINKEQKARQSTSLSQLKISQHKKLYKASKQI